MSRKIRRTPFVFAFILCVAGIMASLSGRQAQPATTWQLVGSMMATHEGAAAAALTNGIVIVAGGRDGQGVVTASVDGVSATTGSSALASLLVARADHTATRLKDGRVLVAGGTGTNGSALSSAEIFDPATSAWTAVPMLHARAHHTATRLDDGRVVIAGGEAGGAPVASIEIFNPSINAFGAFTSSLAAARTRAAAAGLTGGRVLIAGGSDGTNALATTEIVNVAAGTVTAGPAMIAARANFTATSLLNHDVLVAGGTDGTGDLASAERFDASAGAFVAAAGLNGGRQGHTAVLLPENNAVLIAGGTASGQGLLATELFLPESAYFQLSGPTTTAHVSGIASETTTAGVAIAAGGHGTAAIERYRYATVRTDQADYAPGSAVTITGAGWVPGEQVLLDLRESPDFDQHPLLSVIADSQGNIVSDEFSPDHHDIGISFYLTAYGSQSEAQTVFTDAADGNGSMTVSPGLVLGGTTGNTFTFTFTNTAGTAFSAGSLVTVGIPAGGWSPSQTTPGTPGLVTVNAGTCAGVSLTSVTASLITVAQTCASGASLTITYSNVTTPAAAATYTFTTQSQDGPTGAANIVTQPTVTVTGTRLVITALNGGASPTAGTTFSVTIQNQNAGGTPVNVTAATGVGLSRTVGTGTLGGTTAGTIASGTSSVTISGVTYTKAESGVVLTAARTSGDTVVSGDSAPFTVNPAAATKLAVTSVNGGSSVTAGTSFPVVVQSQDPNGNPSNVSADTAFSLSRTAGTGALSGTLVGTIAAGSNTVTVTGVTYIKAESGVTITATRTGGDALTAGTSVALLVSPGAADHLTFSAPPTTTVAAATINGAAGVKVDVRDAFENVVTTDTRSVTLAIGTNPGGGTLSGSATIAAVAGVATFSTLSIDKAGTGYTLAAASSPALTTPVSSAFNITAGAPSKLVVASVNGGANPVAGTAFAVVVQSQDAAGNLANQTGNTNIALSRGAGTGTLGGTLTGIIATGTSAVTISGATYTKAESGVTIVATRTSGGTAVSPGTSAPFTVDLGAPHHLTITTAPTNTVSTAAINGAGGIVVQVRDAGNNLIPTDTRDVTLAIGTNPGSGTLSGTATVAAVGGVATFTGLSIDKAGTGYTLAATSSPALTGATSAAFNITAGAVTKLGITTINGGSNPVAGTAFSVVVRSQDAGGNPVNVTAATGVSLSLKTGTGTLGGTLTGSIANGTNSVTISGVTYTRAESGVVLTATRTSGNTLTPGDSAAFTVNPGVPTKLAVTSVNGGSHPAAGTAFAVVVQAQDANNNPANVTLATGFTLSRGSGTATLGGTLTGTIANATNAVTVSGVTYLKAESGVTIVATRTSGNTLSTGTSAAFTVDPGAPDHLTFSVQPATTVAAGSINGAGGIKVDIRDANNNVVTGDTRAVTLAIGTNPGGGTLSGTVTVAAVAGVATFTGLNIDKPGTGYTLAATSTPALTGATSAAFNITLGPASRLAITAVNGGVNPVAGAAFPVDVQSQDAAGNPASVTAATGVSLSLAAGNGTPGGTLTGSIANGTSSVTISGVTYTRAESGVVLSAARTSGNVLAQGNSLPFTVDPAAPDHLSFAAQPAATTADLTMAAVTVQVRDASENVVTGDTRSVTLAIGANPGGGTLSGTTTVSAVAGVATFNTLGIDNIGSGYTLLATSSPALTGATSAGFAITARATSTAVVCVPASTTLNNATTCTASVTDLPANHSLPAGAVTFSSDGSGTFSGGGFCTLDSTPSGPDTASCSVTYTPTSHGTGTHGIGAAYGANGSHAASSASPFALAIVAASQAITVTTAAPSSAVYAQTFPVAATADSGLTVSITASGSCHVSAGGSGSATIAIDNGAGACTVHYNQAGTIDFEPAEEVTNVTNSGHAGQTITFGSLADRDFGAADFALAATASSGLAVSFTASGTCTVAGATAHLSSVGNCTITAHQAGDGNYDPAADVPRTFAINVGTPAITWNDPAAIPFGTALGASELNATTNSDGALTYTPAAGTVLAVGPHTLHVDVAATSNFFAASRDVTLVVVKATPTITWSDPAAITYGTALDATQLNATTSGDGALTYTPAAGTILGGGTRTLHVDAAATASYDATSKDVTILVNPATPTMIWNDPAGIIYGTALGAAELNATTSGDGALTYTPAAGTILGGGPHTLHVDAAATANYVAASKDVTIVVGKAAPTITWSDPAAITYSTPLDATELNATTNSDGALTYTPAAGTVLGAGPRTLHVDAAATANFLAAGKDVALTVVKLTPTITWSDPATIGFGTALGAAQLDATTNGDGALTYTPGAGTVLSLGPHTLHVDAAATANCNASSKDVTITVGPGMPTITWNPPAPMLFGTALGALQLNATSSGDGALTYTPPAGTVLPAGANILRVDSAATASYVATFMEVTIVVNKTTPTITWNSPVGITLGTALGASELNATTTSDGALTYTPPAGTVLGVGTHVLHVDAAETASFLPASREVLIAVGAAPGGILESATSTDVRPVPTPADLAAFLPERGRFTFPAPYNTTGVRLTNAHDCSDWYDCVNGAGGASWRNMNNSAGSNFLYIVLGLDKTNGGVGPSLFRYDKTTGETLNLGGLFDPDDDRNWGNLDGWYFSPSLPTKFYIGLDAQLTRYDVLAHTTSVVFDITSRFGDDKEVYHAQSSKDDRVHSFTLRLINNREQLGCGVFREDTQQFSYFPGVGAFHECQIDQSGQWLLIKEDRDNTDGEDDRIVNLYTGAETVLLRTAGAAGQSDNGYGSMVALDATAALPSAIRTWAFGPLAPGPIVYHSLVDLPPSFTQVSFANARSAALDQQFACGGAVNRTNAPRTNEIACVRLDGSLTTLTLAPTMTDLDALGGGPNDDVIKQPLGTLDPTGEFFLWTTNLLGDRIDAFLVHVPTQRLVTPPVDTTVPTVAITAPADAATVFGTTALTVAASDDTGVAGVQFQLDGTSLGAEITTAPFTGSWDTTTVPDGVHVLTAVARDAAGNFTVSLPVSITVLNSPDAPQISNVTVTGVIERLATVQWHTSQLADSSIEYGPTTAYGQTTAVDPTLTANHLLTLTSLTPGTTYHFRAVSKNAQDVTGTSADLTFTTQSAPTITAVGVSAVTNTSATISWTTDLPSDTMIEWGPTTNYGDATNPDENFTTSHVQGLYDLEPGAMYHFRVYSVTPEGVLSVSADFTFSTVGNPVISGLTATGVNPTTETISWTTDNPANTVVEYGLTAAYGSTTGPDGSFVLTHSRTLTGLTAGTTYHYRVTSSNIYGLSTTSADTTFTTLDPPAAVISNVTASGLTGSSATIGWTTDLASNSQVAYGTTTGYGLTTALDPALVTTHSQTLGGLTPGTTYHYQLTSIVATGQVATSADFTFTSVAPPAISGLNASGVTSASATIGWTTDQASSSLVEYGTGTSYGSATAPDPAPVTTHSKVLSGLDAGTTYHYRVTSTNAVGLTTTSGDATFTTVAPPAISGVDASAITGTAATIGWTTDQASSSRVEYGPTTSYGSSTALDATLVTAHSQDLSGLSIGTTYHYRVVSANTFGQITTSADASFATVAAPVISGVNASAIVDVSATIGWTTTPAADSRVEYGLTSTYGSTTTLDATLVTTHSQGLSGLTAGATYHYRVISTDLAAQTTSGDFTFTTVTHPVISAVSASGIAGTAATVNWTTDQTASSQVEYGLTTAYGSATTLDSALVTAHSQSVTGLAPGTTYHVRVRSSNGAGLLAVSVDFTVTTTAPPVISGVGASSITGTTATVAWTTNQTADTQVEFGPTTTYGSTTTLDGTLVTAHSQVVTGLTPGTTYHYRARSTNGVGLLATSADDAFTTPAVRSILVVSPHPDDDLLFAGGITARAVSQGASVKIAFVTNGDACCQPFGVSLGLMREGEAVNGQSILGVAESNLLFLGYPDSYLTTIRALFPNADQTLTTSWSQSTTYANRGLGGTDWHTYHFGAPANYNATNIRLDLTSILQTYRPDDIYTTAEFDQHGDHSSTYALVTGAIADATAADATYRPILHKTIVHAAGQQADWPGPPNPQAPFTEPPGLVGVTWADREHIDVPLAMQNPNLSVNPKALAIGAHTSQGGVGGWVGGFLRSDEFFWRETSPTPTPVLTVTPSPVAFGNRPVGATASLTITIANTGTGPLTIATPLLPASPFGATGLPASGTVIGAGNSVTATVTFTPTALTSSMGFLVVQSDGGNAPITLTGTGSTAPTAVLSVTPDPMTFGNAIVNTTASRTITIANLGGTALTITSTTAPSAPFGASGLPANGTVIAAGGSLTATITFEPPTATAASGSLVVESGAGSATVNLTGTGVLTQPIPSPLAGGWQLNGSASIVGSSLQLTPATPFLGGSAFWPAAVSSGNLTIDFDATITGGNGADGMTFAMIDPAAGATALGSAGGALGFSPIPGVAVTLDTYQNGNDPSSNFVGIATGYTGTVDTLVYAATSTAVPNLQSGPHHFTVTTRDGRVRVTIDGTQYLDQAVSLPGSVLVGFTGGTGGLTNQHLVANVALTVEDLTPSAVLAVTPNPVDFGATAVGTTASRSITITNIGNTSMAIGAITLPSAPFDVTGLPIPGDIVAAGDSLTATVTFTPAGPGQTTDALVMQTDDGPVTVTLTGGVTKVTSVSSPTPNGTYGIGAVIPIDVTFNAPVIVTGSPQLTLATGVTNAVLNYTSGSGTATLTFTYTIAAGHNAADLDYLSTTALALNGGTIVDALSGAATLALPAPGAAGSLGANQDLVVDTTAPTVTSVTSAAANGAYLPGNVIPIQVVFSEPVTVTGTPRLTLDTGGAPNAVVNYSSGGGTNTLVFNYTVAVTDVSADLDYVSTAALSLNGGTIRDGVNNPATVTLAAPGETGSLGANKDLVINPAPTVTNVTSSTANGTYGAGTVMPIQVVFSKIVTVTGTPRLTLATGTNAVVNYTSGSGTATLTFNYTVAAGQSSVDLDYVSTTALALNGGTIRDAAANPAILTLPAPGAAGSLGANKSLVVDTTAPTVIDVTSSTANGTYGVGAAIPVQVTFSEPVTVTGTPQLTLAASPNVAVNYTSGSGTATLTFTYTVASGQSSADLNYAATNSLTLNGGTIRDAAANAAVLTLPALAGAGSLGTNKNLVIDGVAPTVTNVTSSTANGTYGIGTVIPVTVTFSEAVVVTGTPQLTLAVTPNTAVNYASGSGTNTLTFNYTVAAGNATADLNYVATSSLGLNGGTIRDTSGNNATLTLPATGGAGSLGTNRNIVIDGVVPTVTNVTSSTANGTYGAGAVISIQVVFSEAVTVTGTPRLTLATGNNAVVNYTSGSGTTTLTFTYTVASGQSSADLDYVSTAALALNGGTIRDAAANAATLTLPAPGAAGSLGANKSIVISALTPDALLSVQNLPAPTVPAPAAASPAVAEW